MWLVLYLHCKKRFAIFPGIIKLFPTRESLVSDIPAGDGKIVNLFYSVWELMEKVLITNAMHNMRNQMRGPNPWKHKQSCDTSLSRPASEKLKTIVFTYFIHCHLFELRPYRYVSKPYFKSVCGHFLSLFVYGNELYFYSFTKWCKLIKTK